MRRKKPGKKVLQKILSESAFNPDELGPLKTIIDIGDPAYCELRAIEFIQESKLHLERTPFPTPHAPSKMYHTKIQLAISLLAMARAMRSHESASTQE